MIQAFALRLPANVPRLHSAGGFEDGFADGHGLDGVLAGAEAARLSLDTGDKVAGLFAVYVLLAGLVPRQSLLAREISDAMVPVFSFIAGARLQGAGSPAW